MMPMVLYLTQTLDAAEAVQRRYSRDVLRTAPLASQIGHRGDVVVIEPLPPGATGREQEQFAQLVEQARTKVRRLEGVVVLGEVI